MIKVQAIYDKHTGWEIDGKPLFWANVMLKDDFGFHVHRYRLVTRDLTAITTVSALVKRGIKHKSYMV
jgi:hypothetical protein